MFINHNRKTRVIEQVERAFPHHRTIEMQTFNIYSIEISKSNEIQNVKSPIKSQTSELRSIKQESIAWHYTYNQVIVVTFGQLELVVYC